MIWFALLLSPTQSAATYIALAERAQRVAQAITSQVDCERLGFFVDMEGIKAEGVSFLNDAVKTRIRMESAQDMITSSVAREEAAIAHRASEVRKKNALPAYERWWQTRCDGLATDPVYAKYFRRR